MSQRGFTLLELAVSVAILVTVILGVGFLFSTGKGNVDRLAWRRAALAQAQLRLEQLLHNPASGDTTTPAIAPVSGEFGDGTSPTNTKKKGLHNGPSFKLDGVKTATEVWRIWYEDDPADSLVTSPGGDLNNNPLDNKRVREVIIWSTGIGAQQDSVFVESTLPPRLTPS